jgi:hypothetical protein
MHPSPLARVSIHPEHTCIPSALSQGPQNPATKQECHPHLGWHSRLLRNHCKPHKYYCGTVTLPLFTPPFGPVTVPLAVVVVPLFLVVPVAVVVPPCGPVTEAESAVPVRVFVAVAVPEAVAPFALVAVPVAVTDLPVCVTLVDAVPPRFPVTDFCAYAAVESERIRPALKVAISFIFISVSFESELLDHSDTRSTQSTRPADIS